MAVKVKEEPAEVTPFSLKPEDETLPKLLLRNYRRYGDKRVAERRKDFGVWQEYTWKDVYEHVKWFSLGLVSMGLERGDRLALIGNNEPELYWGEWAAQAAGAISVSIFVDCLPPEIKYYVQHSEAKFIVAEDQEQVDKAIQIMPECPSLKKVIYWDPRGLWFYDEPYLMSWQQVEALGKEYEKDHPHFFEESIERGRADDVAIFSYTSGTTGLPKGAMLSHKNIIFFSRNVRQVIPFYDTDNYVSYISPAWATEQFLGITSGLDAIMTVNFPEEPETVQEDVRDIGPDLLFYVPRLWEDLASLVRVKIEETSWWKRLLYRWGIAVGERSVAYLEKKKRPPFYWRALNKIADAAVLKAVRDQIGLRRARACFTAAMAVSPDLVKFYWALGSPMYNIYGSTECGLVSAAPKDEIKFETVGRVLPWNQLKVVDGEIRVKTGGLFAGYWKNPEATQKRFDEDGFYRTGDGGWLDEDSHLIYWDRIEELLPLADGSKFAPQFSEVRLRFSPYIKDAMVLGGEGRPYVTAVVNMDFRSVGRWAEAHHVAFTTYTDLSQKPQVLELLKKDVDRVNKLVPAPARIRRFVNLHKEFDPDEAELTRTRKLKRGVMENKYADIVRGLYGEGNKLEVEAQVTYQDGRKGTIKTELGVTQMEV